MAPHSSTLAWKIPWAEEPGKLQSMGSLRVGHNWATSLSLFTFMHWRRKWQPTPVFLPGKSQGGRAWWATVYGVAQSQTWLKQLSSSSSSSSSMYGCESWIIKKDDCWRTHAFELWCWRRLLRVPWTARRSNSQSKRKSTLNIHWKNWCWSWSSNTLVTWWEELTHWKRPSCWER